GLRGFFGQSNVDVMFGAGNNENILVLADVHKQTTTSVGNVIDMRAGVIDGNKQASKRNVINYFQSGSPTAMKENETLFLFVSDHGLGISPYTNNMIDLWRYDASTMSSSGD